MGHIQVRKGRDAEAETIYAKVLADYAGHPKLAEAVHVMGEGYFLRAYQPAIRGEITPDGTLSAATKAYILKAIEKWEYVVTQLPVDAHTTPTVHYYLATAYRQLGDPAKAIQYASRMVELWPDHPMSWRAQGLVVKICKHQIPKNEPMEASPAAEAMTEVARQLVEKYPTSPVASAARKWLDRTKIEEQGGEK